MNIHQIEQFFYNEFGPIKTKFKIFELSLEEAQKSQDACVWHPGVYVWWVKSSVIRVGRHLTNSRKRALEHISSNTGGKFDQYASDPSLKVLLFNVIDPKDNHWVASLEIFFEKTLNPKIPSKRLG